MKGSKCQSKQHVKNGIVATFSIINVKNVVVIFQLIIHKLLKKKRKDASLWHCI